MVREKNFGMLAAQRWQHSSPPLTSLLKLTLLFCRTNPSTFGTKTLTFWYENPYRRGHGAREEFRHARGPALAALLPAQPAPLHPGLYPTPEKRTALSGLQGYLAHKKTPPPRTTGRLLGIGLLKGPCSRPSAASTPRPTRPRCRGVGLGCGFRLSSFRVQGSEPRGQVVRFMRAAQRWQHSPNPPSSTQERQRDRETERQRQRDTDRESARERQREPNPPTSTQAYTLHPEP